MPQCTSEEDMSRVRSEPGHVFCQDCSSNAGLNVGAGQFSELAQIGVVGPVGLGTGGEVCVSAIDKFGKNQDVHPLCFIRKPSRD
jgi:hypothetical protein